MRKKSTKTEAQANSAMGEAWGGLLEYVCVDLAKESNEGAVLRHLALFPFTAFDIAWSEMGRDDLYCRCVAALIPSYVPTMRGDALSLIWETEREWRKKAKRDQLMQAASNAVAERIVISAIRLMRVPERRKVAITVLKEMISDAIRGTDWNDSHYACAALIRGKVVGAKTLAKRFAASKLGKSDYATFMSTLLDGDPRAFAECANWEQDPSDNIKLPAARARQVRKLVAACKDWEPFAQKSAEADE
jgi:hypothetical protein